MIDLHTHILPGLDDGPATMAKAIAMARVAHLGGVRTMIATPHVREDYPFPIELIKARLEELTTALAEEGLELVVEGGAEVAISKVAELDDSALRTLCLGSGPYMLVESPYSHATSLLESTLFDLQVRGFRPILAHPERSPAFLGKPARLKALVEKGVLCSITAGSLEGQFGTPVKRLAVRLLNDGLVHNVASDAHDARRRPPLRRQALDTLHPSVPALRDRARWLTTDGPAAVLVGAELPPAPPLTQGRVRMRSFFRRG